MYGTSGSYSGDAIARALGHKTYSGSARMKVATPRHFGFLAVGKSTYELTDSGRKLTDPEATDKEKRKLLRHAIREPALYAQLYNAYRGKALPPALAEVLAHQYKISPAQKQSTAEIFRQSLQDAGLLSEAGVVLEIEALDTVDDTGKTSAGNNATVAELASPAPDQANVDRDGTMRHAVPLTTGPGVVRVGDLVQWISQSMAQFALPRRVTAVHGEGDERYVQVEGSQTSIPIVQVEVIQRIDTTDIPMHAPSKEQTSATNASVNNLDKATRYTIPLNLEGKIGTLEIPMPLAVADLDAVSAWVAYIKTAFLKDKPDDQKR